MTRDWVVEAANDWGRSYEGTISLMSITLALEPLVAAYGWDRIRPCWIAYTQHVEEHQADPRSFARLVPTQIVADEKPKAPPRITEALLTQLRADVPSCVGEHQGVAAPWGGKVLALVAEVRRLRKLIVAGRVDSETLYTEACAILNEEKTHE